MDNENKIIKRDRAVDFNESGRTHFVTHYKYDEEGNKIWEKLEAINKGENIIRVAIHGATAISYIYNLVMHPSLVDNFIVKCYPVLGSLQFDKS